LWEVVVHFMDVDSSLFIPDERPTTRNPSPGGAASGRAAKLAAHEAAEEVKRRSGRYRMTSPVFICACIDSIAS
jgi:hypothetical protein